MFHDVPGERPDRLRPRAFAAIHVQRQANDKSYRLAIVIQVEQAVQHRSQFPSFRNGLDRTGNHAEGVAGSHAHGLRPGVEPEKRTGGREIGNVNDRHGLPT
jgi:hypothetical protein